MAYTTLAAVRTYLGVGATIDDSLLTAWIPAAQSQIDQRCRRTFEATADTTRYYRSDDIVTGDWARRRESLWYRTEGLAELDFIISRSGILDLATDVASISLLLNGDLTTITADQYWLLPRNELPRNAIQLKSTAQWAVNEDQEIAVTGRFAYALTAPADITLATQELIAYWYRSRDSQIFEVIQLPGGQLMVPHGWPAVVEAILTRGQYIKPLGVI